MTSDRVTISLNEDTRTALDQLIKQTNGSRSEIVRDAISFYAANFESARTSDSDDLQTYYQMLTTGEHVLLDVDLLHAFLEAAYVSDEPDPAFLETVDTVAHFHVQEYAERFDSLGEVLDWLSLCGFLSVRQSEGNTYHVVFPSEPMRWFMMRFLEGSVEGLPFELEIEESVSKVLLRECDN